MDIVQLLTLALLQGITEFLPISSSAHLILVPVLTDWPDQGLAFDVAVHVGTLAAVVIYFRREIAELITAWLRSLQTRRYSETNAYLAWAILFATIPVGIVGLLAKDAIELYLRSPLVIALATIGFGLLLGWADRLPQRTRDEYSLRWKEALLIGCAQALALIPGTSRSGVTLTAGLFLGLSREAAARFSFLLSIPVILLAGGLATLDLVRTPSAVAWDVLLSGALLSGISAYICIHTFLGWIARIGLLPFVIYRLLLGTALLIYAL